MPNKKMIFQITAIFASIVFVGSISLFSFANEESLEPEKKVDMQQVETQYEEYIKSIDHQYQTAIDKEASRLKGIYGQIEHSLIQFGNSQEQEENNKLAIIEKAKIATTLEESVTLFNEEINRIEQKITALETQIWQKEQRITEISKNSLDLESDLEAQKKIVFNLLETLQVSDQEFNAPKELESALTFIFTDASVSENIRDRRALLMIAKKSREIFYELDSATTKLNDANFTLQKENTSLEELKTKLQNEKLQLETQKNAKETLLSETKNSEMEYQRLWKVSSDQMQESALAVKELKDESLKIQEKLQELESKRKLDRNLVSKDRIQEIMKEEGSLSIEELGRRFAVEDSQELFSWPVEPTLGISAYFQDENYKKIFGQSHNAIDIPVLQGTEIHAPSAGYVYQVTDNGYGYSYIILLHRNNLRTVYGHISEILVSEGDIVREGQVIGKSGGIPGTKGAGTMTTGAHLHFEVLKKDEYQNPLEYLPLSTLRQYENNLQESRAVEEKILIPEEDSL